MAEPAEAREKIRAKQKAEFLTMVAGMAGGVAGKMDRTKAMPDVEFIAIADQSSKDPATGLRSRYKDPTGVHPIVTPRYLPNGS